MHSLKEIQIKCNKKFIVNFDGSKPSSDGGLFIIKEFFHTLVATISYQTPAEW